jgi:ABC-type Mn2+/Zn2+ transport system ATPase subunit
LSGGECQRVKIALGLAQQPQLLLLDEPTQHLNIGRQLEMADLIRSLSARGIAILASMHDLTLIEGTFSSVWLLSPERVSEKGRQRRYCSRNFWSVPSSARRTIIPFSKSGSEEEGSEFYDLGPDVFYCRYDRCHCALPGGVQGGGPAATR